MPSRPVFPFLSLLFFNMLSPAQAMMEDAITTEGPPLPPRQAPPSTPTIFADDGVEIDYAYIQPAPLETRESKFSQILHEKIIGRHMIRLKNVPFNSEMAAQLSFILRKESLKPKHLDLVCCTVQDYTTLYNFNSNFKNLKKLDVRVVMGEPLELRNPNAYAHPYAEEKSLKNGAKALADVLSQIPGLSVRKSSAHETVTIDFRALKTEDVTQDPSVPFLTALAQIEDGTKEVTIKNTPFTQERACALLYHLQQVRALDKPTTPSVERLNFEECFLENYSALTAFKSNQGGWAPLNVIVTFSQEQSSPILPSVLRPTTQDWFSFFENLNTGPVGRREATYL